MWGLVKEQLINMDMPNEDYYAMTVGSGKEREILYEEILKPGGEYLYVQDLNQRSGRIHVLEEAI